MRLLSPDVGDRLRRLDPEMTQLDREIIDHRIVRLHLSVAERDDSFRLAEPSRRRFPLDRTADLLGVALVIGGRGSVAEAGAVRLPIDDHRDGRHLLRTLHTLRIVNLDGVDGALGFGLPRQMGGNPLQGRREQASLADDS